MAIPTIITPRLRLRAFADADADRLHHLMGEKDVLRYFPTTDPPAREQVEAMIAGQRSHWATHGHGLWAVESRVAYSVVCERPDRTKYAVRDTLERRLALAPLRSVVYYRLHPLSMQPNSRLTIHVGGSSCESSP